MAADPWEVPQTPEGRETLVRLAGEYEAAGQLRELGCTLTRLSRLCWQIGAGDLGPAGAVALSAGNAAVAALRQVDDMKALAAALRAAAQPFHRDADAMLREAHDLAQEAEDISGKGWALFAMSKGVGADAGPYLDEAWNCFERVGEERGLACIEQHRGVQGRDHRLIVRAAERFETAGDLKSAERAYIMATVFGRAELSENESENLTQKAILMAGAREDLPSQLMYMRLLARRKKEVGRLDEMKSLRQRARALHRRIKKAAAAADTGV